jgi:small conductance mechanosensitive channel
MNEEDEMELAGFDLTETLNSLTELLSTWGLKVVGAIAVLIIGMTVAKMIRGSMTRGLAKTKLDPTLIPFLAGIVYYAVVAFVVTAVLGLFGIQTTSLIALLGAAGLAVGLALQGTLGNFSAGVMLLIFRPFRAGDFVEAGGVAGAVQEVGIFSTTLATPDNVRIIVPNSSVYGQTIKNYAANPTRRNDMVFGISYSDDIGRAIETINRILAADERVLKEPAPVVAVSELGDSSVNLVVRPWCKKEDYWALRFDLNRTLKEELEAAGCSIPFPQRDVHLYNESAAA